MSENHTLSEMSCQKDVNVELYIYWWSVEENGRGNYWSVEGVWLLHVLLWPMHFQDFYWFIFKFAL